MTLNGWLLLEKIFPAGHPVSWTGCYMKPVRVPL